jgi:translation initiation factor IF-3
MSKVVSTNLRCNEQIRLTPVRVIGAANEQLGVIETYEALRQAREQGLDLVEVAPNERPPVCKIMDYGKFKYQQKKGQKRHHEQQLKEVRMRPKTDEHDREIKVNHAIRFLAKGDKVQFTMVFRGRERAHRDIALNLLRGVITQLGELVKVERPPIMDGRNMVMIIAPNKAAIEKYIADGKMAKHQKGLDQEPEPIADDEEDDAPETPAQPARQ